MPLGADAEIKITRVKSPTRDSGPPAAEQEDYTVPIFVDPIPDPKSIDPLRPLLEHRDDADFAAQLVESLTRARNLASNGGLNPALYKALPLPGMNGWPTTFDEYVEYLVAYSRWIPQQSTDPAWLDPGNPLGEHQEVYDRLCWFYWLINQPLESLSGGVLQEIGWFADFLVEWANAWGDFLDSTDSFNEYILQAFMDESPKYRVQDSMIPISEDSPKLRSNNPSGWKTFNQFFARELNPGLRPVASLADNTVITVPPIAPTRSTSKSASPGRSSRPSSSREPIPTPLSSNSLRGASTPVLSTADILSTSSSALTRTTVSTVRSPESSRSATRSPGRFTSPCPCPTDTLGSRLGRQWVRVSAGTRISRSTRDSPSGNVGIEPLSQSACAQYPVST